MAAELSYSGGIQRLISTVDNKLGIKSKIYSQWFEKFLEIIFRMA